MNHLLLRWRYSVEMVNAYLAYHMGEGDVVANHLFEADKIALEIWREKKSWV